MATRAKDRSTGVKKESKAAKDRKSGSKKATTKASSKSQELVVDSEDEDAAPEDRNVRKVLAQPVSLQPSSAGKHEASGPESEEDEDESDDESDDANRALPPRPPNKVPSNVNGVKRSASQASSSGQASNDGSDDDESLADEPATKKTKVDAGAGPQGGHTVIARTKGKSYSSATVPDPAAGSVEQTSETAPIKPQPFEVPAGYVAVDLKTAGTTGIAASSLAGKQIWHITAPSNLPLTSLHNIAQSALQDGKVLLNHKGVDYTIADDPTNSELPALLLSNGSTLDPVKQKPSRRLRIQQQIDLPNLSSKQTKQTTGSAAAAEVARAPVSTVRPQPENLRMRFHPLGVESTATVAWDDEEALADAAPAKGTTLQFPRTLGASGISESHERSTTGVEAAGDGSIEKPKKKRKEKALASGTKEAAEASHQDGVAATVAATPTLKIAAPETDGGVTMTGVEDMASKPSKEEKARRKEEKRLRKEAKLKDKTA